MNDNNFLVDYDEPILITGANGFIGTRVVETLLGYGFENLRCFVRWAGNLQGLGVLIAGHPSKIQMFEGNLLAREDCKGATKGVSLVFHLAAGTEKTFPGCYMNSVVSTRNLLDSILDNGNLKRFVNVSSLAAYSNADTNRNGVLDETCEIDLHPELRYEAYTYGKVKQDEMVLDYAKRFRIPSIRDCPSGRCFWSGEKEDFRDNWD